MAAALETRLTRLEGGRQREAPDSPTLSRLKGNPSAVMALAGYRPDPWQARVLRSSARRTLLLCSRQAGKSRTAAALAVREALCRPASLVLVLSPSERQSGELAAKVFEYYDALGRPVPARKRTELQLHLTNGSRVVALPENEKTVRGYSGARLLLVDEAARVDDALYRAVRPMLAVSQGRLVALSTPFGKRGWFFEAWESGAGWARERVTAEQCPRIPRDFLAEERTALGDRWYRQEYLCSFEEAIDAVFSTEDIQAAIDGTVRPLFGA